MGSQIGYNTVSRNVGKFLTFLGLMFLKCKTGIITPQRFVVKILKVNTHKAFGNY